MNITETSYLKLLAEIRQSIQTAQKQVSSYVNRSMIELYWYIGKTITERQEKEGWGKAVVEQLSKDLKAEFPAKSLVYATTLYDL